MHKSSKDPWQQNSEISEINSSKPISMKQFNIKSIPAAKGPLFLKKKVQKIDKD